MIDQGYVEMGVRAMARAHLAGAMSGHLGAAVIAGGFIAEQHPELDPGVRAGIEAELDRIIAGESVFARKGDADAGSAWMFAPFPEDERREPAAGEATGGPAADVDERVAPIAVALSANIDHARSSGHNVIFASIALRALTDHPALATPVVVDGVRALVATFDRGSPGSGYYGPDRGRVDGRDVRLPPAGDFPPYFDLVGMAEATVDALLLHASERREGFGGLWHMINHAAALIELSHRGYAELSNRGLPAHYEHLRLWRTVPDVSAERGAETPTDHDPLDPEFWVPARIRRGRAHLTHRIKTLYGFHVVLELVEDPARRAAARERLRYLM